MQLKLLTSELTEVGLKLSVLGWSEVNSIS